MIKRNKGPKRTAHLIRQPSTKSATAGITGYSKEGQVRQRLYSRLRKEFFEKEENQTCQINAPGGCQGNACDIQHTKGHGKYLLDVTTWKAGCRYCNWFCDTHSEWALATGNAKSRL